MGGDLNTQDDAELCFPELDAVTTRATRPLDNLCNPATNAKRSKVYDWVLPGFTLEDHGLPLELGSQTFPWGLVLDSRVFTPLEDLAGVLVDDSGEEFMQHMAVVRDFAVPLL